jgi:hypothetical protein
MPEIRYFKEDVWDNLLGIPKVRIGCEACGQLSEDRCSFERTWYSPTETASFGFAITSVIQTEKTYRLRSPHCEQGVEVYEVHVKYRFEARGPIPWPLPPFHTYSGEFKVWVTADGRSGWYR